MSHRAARVRAAEADSSLSALVAAYLRSLGGERPNTLALRLSRPPFWTKSIASAPPTGWAVTSCTAVRFADTNILLYAVSRDPGERGKAERARGLLTERDLVLSVQVLQEFYVQATRDGRADPLTHEQAAKLIESFCASR